MEDTPLRGRHGGEADTDPRLIEYIKALHACDVDKLIDLRLEYGEDEIATRFRTVERVHKDLLALYAREIQILRLEVEGWRSMCDGQDTLADEEATSQDKSLAKQAINRGLEKIERALVYRKSHDEVDLQKLSRTP